MSEVDLLQQIWQTQEVAGGCHGMKGPDLLTLDRELRRSEKRENRLSRMKTWAVAVLMVLMGVTLRGSFAESPCVVLGFFWILLCAGIFLAVYWKYQFRVCRLPFAENTRTFIEGTLGAYERHLNMLRLGLPLLVGSLILGWNLTFLDAFASQENTSRLLLHGGFSLTMAATGWMGYRIRIRRYRFHLEPQIETILNMKGELAHEAER